MKTCIRILAGLFLAGVPQQYAMATSCRARVAYSYASPVYSAPVYDTPVYAATYVPVAIAIPQYSVSYDSSAGQLQALRQELAILRQELRSTQTPPQSPQPQYQPPAQQPYQPQQAAPQQMPPAAPDQQQAAAHGNVLNVFTAKCASCHDASVAATKGGKFVLTQGNQLAPLGDREARKVLSQTFSERMPKGGKLTDQEMSAIIDWSDNIK